MRWGRRWPGDLVLRSGWDNSKGVQPPTRDTLDAYPTLAGLICIPPRHTPWRELGWSLWLARVLLVDYYVIVIGRLPIRKSLFLRMAVCGA